MTSFGHDKAGSRSGDFALVDGRAPSTRMLTAYQVGDNDMVAAYDPAGALRVLFDQVGEENYNDLTEDDVVIVGDKTLDSMQAFDQDSGEYVNLEESLRQLMAKMTEPRYLWGWE